MTILGIVALGVSATLAIAVLHLRREIDRLRAENAALKPRPMATL